MGCDVRGPGTTSKVGSKEAYGKYSDCGEVRRAPLVPGRGDAMGIRNRSQSWAIFLLDMGRGGSRSGGWPNTRPVAAAATTVPVPTSCKQALKLASGVLQRKPATCRREMAEGKDAAISPEGGSCVRDRPAGLFAQWGCRDVQKK